MSAQVYEYISMKYSSLSYLLRRELSCRGLNATNVIFMEGVMLLNEATRFILEWGLSEITAVSFFEGQVGNGDQYYEEG